MGGYTPTAIVQDFVYPGGALITQRSEIDGSVDQDREPGAILGARRSSQPHTAMDTGRRRAARLSVKASPVDRLER